MESLVSLACSQQVVCNSPLPTASIWQDVLAQAVTGELTNSATVAQQSRVDPLPSTRNTRRPADTEQNDHFRRHADDQRGRHRRVHNGGDACLI